MSEPAHPRRTTVLVGLGLALLLAVAYAVVSWSSPEPPARAGPTPLPPSPTIATPTPTPTPHTPRQGSAYPVRRLGALTDRSVIVNGRANADLRYRRAPGNGTRVHFICTGCDADTWLVEWPRGNPVGGGPLAEPADVTWAVDTVALGDATSLLVKASAGARWILTLTPFDAIPVHEQTFDALGDDVIAVRSAGDLRLTCGSAVLIRTLARPAGADEYAVVQLREDDQAGTWPVSASSGTDLMVLMVSCAGRWRLTLP